MNVRFGMVAFLFFATVLSGQFIQPDHASGQNAGMASYGGPFAPQQTAPSSLYDSGYHGGNVDSVPQAEYSGGIADGYSTSPSPPLSMSPSREYCEQAGPGASIMTGGGQACAPGAMIVEGDPGCPSPSPPGVASLGNFAPGCYGGFEFLWLRPSFGQDVALIIDPPIGNTLVPFEYDNSLTPRAWLGWQSCRGNGARFTYFGYSDEADPVSVTAVAGATPVYVTVFGAGSNLTRNATANPGETLTSRHRLRLQAYDIEATQQFCLASTQMMFGLGVRIADIDQMLRADVHDATSGAAQEAVSNHLEFQGAGPTASLWLTRQIMASRFSFYSNLRGAFLIGDTDQRIYQMKGAFTTELEDRAVHREILTNAECSVGLQFGQSLTPRCGAFLRAGYEGQIWMDAGGPVNSDSTLGFDGITFALGLAL